MRYIEYIVIYTEMSATGPKVDICYHNAEKGSLGPFKNSWFIGKGREHLRKLLNDCWTNLVSDMKFFTQSDEKGRDATPSEAGYSTLLNLISDVSASQYGLGLGLKDQWGGGFEIACLIEGKITKLDGLVFKYYVLDKAFNKADMLDFTTIQFYNGSDLLIFGQHRGMRNAKDVLVPHPLRPTIGRVSANAKLVVSRVFNYERTLSCVMISGNRPECGGLVSNGSTDEIRCDPEFEQEILFHASGILRDRKLGAAPEFQKPE